MKKLMDVQMPPQGESTGLAIEDGVLLARVFSSLPEKSISEIFSVYEETRRPRINTAYKEAAMRWEGVKDRGWFLQKLIEWLMWFILWYKMDAFEASLSYDVRKEELVR
jgi:salicylate hydroxylase